MFKTFDNPATFVHDDESFVFFLGCKPHPGIRRTRQLALGRMTEASLALLDSLSPAQLQNGVSVVIEPKAYLRDLPWSEALHRRIAAHYCKYVVFPRKSSTIPDQFNVRGKSGAILIQREIARMRNMPLYLRFPLCDALNEVTAKPPLLLLLPGPSLAATANRLAEARDTCLIACVGRSLRFCLDQGVAPDFVVHLDTDMRMEALLDPGRDLPDTYLVTLSPAHLSRAALRYKGVFFMDSFDLSVLPNPYRLRESWLGCAVSLLGLAEVLGSPTVVLAGADHAWYAKGTTFGPYHGAHHAEATPPEPFPGPALIANTHDAPDPNQFDSFAIPDRNGFKAFTYFHYQATALELEQAASEIAATTGTQFYVLTEAGILSKRVFQEGGEAALAVLPRLDRERLGRELARANGRGEVIDTKGLLKAVTSARDSVRQQAAYIDLMLGNGDIDQATRHPFVLSLRQLGEEFKFPILREPEQAARTTVRACREWITAMEAAMAMLHLANATGEKDEVLLLCHPDEEYLALEEDFRRRYPRASVLAAYLVMVGINRVSVRHLDSSRLIPFETLIDHTTARHVVIVTQRACETYGTVFRQLDQSALLVWEELVTRLPAWPPVPGQSVNPE